MSNQAVGTDREQAFPPAWNLTHLRSTFDFVVSKAELASHGDRPSEAAARYNRVSQRASSAPCADWVADVRTALAYAELRLSEDVTSNEWKAIVHHIRERLLREEAGYEEAMRKAERCNHPSTRNQSDAPNAQESHALAHYLSAIERLAQRRLKADLPSIVGLDGNALSLAEVVRILPGETQSEVPGSRFRQSCEAALTERADLLNNVRSVHAEWTEGRHWLEGVASRDGFTREYTDRLGAAIDSNLEVAHRWYALKAKLLGIPHLSYAQSQRPLEGSVQLTWSRVLRATRDALHSLSPDLRADLDLLIDRERIDLKPRTSGRQDAFCRFVAPGIPPYVHVTWREDWTSVEEWVHELGHAIHALRITCSDPLVYEPSETVAELVASAFAIQVIAPVIKRLTADTEAASLEVHLLDRLVSSIFSLRALWTFEERIQQAAASYEWQHAEMTEIWQDIVTRTMGPSVRLEAGEQWKWATIPHFVDAPGYLWKYVMPDIESLRLMARQSSECQDPWFPLDAFNLGASAELREVEALFPLGGSDKDSWDSPFAVLTTWLAEAEHRVTVGPND